MKRILLALCVMLQSFLVFAAQYEEPMLNMGVPSGLDQGQMYFKFDHKFYQGLNSYPDDDLFALLDNSVNMNLELRYMAVAGLEVNAGYTTDNREQMLGLSYVLQFPDLFFNVQAGLQYFTYRDFVNNNYNQNVFYSVSIQSVPFFDDRLIISLDAAFDGFVQNPGMAIGASFEVFDDISVLAEYYPVIKLDPANTLVGATGVYFFGFKMQTFGHQFIFKFGNSTDMGMRRFMLGTDTLDLYAGFSIMRLIRF